MAGALQSHWERPYQQKQTHASQHAKHAASQQPGASCDTKHDYSRRRRGAVSLMLTVHSCRQRHTSLLASDSTLFALCAQRDQAANRTEQKVTDFREEKHTPRGHRRSVAKLKPRCASADDVRRAVTHFGSRELQARNTSAAQAHSTPYHTTNTTLSNLVARYNRTLVCAHRCQQ